MKSQHTASEAKPRTCSRHLGIRNLGMTLLEIMIVLAIVGGLMMVLSGNLLKSDTSRLREASVEVMATLRVASNLATMTGKHHRVVFDLDAQIYHIEICTGKQTLKQGDEEETIPVDALGRLREKMERPSSYDLNQEILKAGSAEEATEAAAAIAGLRVGATRCQPSKETITGQSSKSGNRHKIDVDRKIRITKIAVQHLNDSVDEGRVTINFFPVGSSEKSVVELGLEETDESFSIVVFGMTSRVEFRGGSVDADEHLRRNGVGEKDEERK